MSVCGLGFPSTIHQILGHKNKPLLWKKHIKIMFSIFMVNMENALSIFFLSIQSVTQ